MASRWIKTVEWSVFSTSWSPSASTTMGMPKLGGFVVAWVMGDNSVSVGYAALRHPE